MQTAHLWGKLLIPCLWNWRLLVLYLTSLFNYLISKCHAPIFCQFCKMRLHFVPVSMKYDTVLLGGKSSLINLEWCLMLVMRSERRFVNAWLIFVGWNKKRLFYTLGLFYVCIIQRFLAITAETWNFGLFYIYCSYFSSYFWGSASCALVDGVDVAWS